jgi:hypothetical protein
MAANTDAADGGWMFQYPEAQQSAVAAGDPTAEPEASSSELQDLQADSPASGSPPAVEPSNSEAAANSGAAADASGQDEADLLGQDPGTFDSSQSPVPSILPLAVAALISTPADTAAIPPADNPASDDLKANTTADASSLEASAAAVDLLAMDEPSAPAAGQAAGTSSPGNHNQSSDGTEQVSAATLSDAAPLNDWVIRSICRSPGKPCR